MNETPTLLLVHGAWHGPWCWEKLTPELEALGFKWATVELPSIGHRGAPAGGVAEDAAAIDAAVGRIEGDVVVVAHSYGGVATTEARLGPKVRHIVYLGAFMPDAGQSLVNLLPPGPLPPFVQGNPDGTTTVAAGYARATFYADCSAELSAWAEAKLRPHNGICNVTPVSRASWRERSSTYIVLTEDFACPTPIQPGLAKQATDSRTIKGSHSPFLAQPKLLADMLGEIVAEHVGGGVRKAG
jgi:pimeloyl-ACP methyl ester carboxylesterase